MICQSSRRVMAAWSVTAAAFLIAGVSASADTHGPAEDLEPREVVRIQLDALRDNGPDNDGIEKTFSFASPANRESTGPLDRFADLFRSPAYRPMLNHESSEVREVVANDDVAAVSANISRADGSTHEYLFILSKQSDPPYEDMWMTDAVQYGGAGSPGEPDPENRI
ncbi:MAG: DUF4864 domain-containing protein [Spirochaetales bacterium]